MDSQPTVATLWGGIGGGMLGFAFAGFRATWAADDRDFVTKKQFLDSWSSWLGSLGRRDLIHFVSPKDVMAGGVRVPDVLVGSPPCKRFSSLAVRKKDRLDFDPEELEYVQFLKAVRKMEPKFFVLENLSAIERHFTWAFSKLDHTPVFSETGSDDALVFLPGYDITRVKLDAAEFHVPQHRKRLYVVGKRIEGSWDNVPPMGVGCTSEFSVVKNAFRDLDGVPNMEKSNHSQERIDGFNALKPGQSYYGTQNNRRIHRDKPGPTVTSHRTQYVHPSEPRTLTVRECARLMGFPDTFQFYGPRTKQLDQVGCGICPPVTFRMAMRIKQELKNG